MYGKGYEALTVVPGLTYKRFSGKLCFSLILSVLPEHSHQVSKFPVGKHMVKKHVSHGALASDAGQTCLAVQ